MNTFTNSYYITLATTQTHLGVDLIDIVPLPLLVIQRAVDLDVSVGYRVHHAERVGPLGRAWVHPLQAAANDGLVFFGHQ